MTQADQAHQPRLIKEERPGYEVDGDTQAAYRERLRQALQDPAFRRIEGFPIGEDEDILALSDPPYYTACPNPFLPEIVAQWQAERRALRAAQGLPEDDAYHREPFASDVSEGKNNPIYNAHSYHTKVPHKAIMRYILHYTDPGDIVFDGFCGTGMTGVAAQLCGDRAEVESLGYVVDAAGHIFEPADLETPIARLGARKAVLNDLSPAATFIAYNYNTPVDVAAFEREAKRILREVERELGWMYETWHPHCDDPNRVKAKINFTVWSDVFVCPECNAEIEFWRSAVDPETKKIALEFNCTACGASHSKRTLNEAEDIFYDHILRRVIKTKKQLPVMINYSVGGTRFEKSPDRCDTELIERVNQSEVAYAFPIERMPEGDESRRNDVIGITNVHHFYTKRGLLTLANLRHKFDQVSYERVRSLLLFLFQSLSLGYTRLNRYGATHFSQVNRILSGTLYISSLMSEVSIKYAYDGKLKRLVKAFSAVKTFGGIALSTQSSTEVSASDQSIDYIFIDPPFGSNLMYSELNFLWEAWLGVRANNVSEAIVNKAQSKGVPEYQRLMEKCFTECLRLLKPGRWLTIEFHNSQNRIWNSIQEAILRSGFIIADVRTMDKQSATFKQVTASGAAKQDLIISAYKPRTEFEKQFFKDAGTEEGAWEFVRQHLVQLPVVVANDGVLETLSERQDYLLFDRMVAFHIQRGATVPLSAAEFYAGLRECYPERDGMFFLPEQVPQYEQARLAAQEVAQLALFVSDEKSAVQWLRQQLDPRLGGRPQPYQEIQPQFLRQLHQARHEALPELSALLDQNFVQDPAGRWYPPDPSSAADLEQLRRRALLREFAAYAQGKKRLKQFRTEAVRTGFADAWARADYATIVQVAERLPEQVLQEDPDLLMYYDNASLRV